MKVVTNHPHLIIDSLPVFSKIFEKVIFQKLFDHLKNNVLLKEHQYGS